MKSRVCVLMATFNGSRFLQEQIDSIRGQSQVNCEIFASDDGSSDNTIEILKKNNVHILNPQKGLRLTLLLLLLYMNKVLIYNVNY